METHIFFLSARAEALKHLHGLTTHGVYAIFLHISSFSKKKYFFFGEKEEYKFE